LVSGSFIGVLDRGNYFSGFESADFSSTYFSVNDLILSNFSILTSLVTTSLFCSNLLDFMEFLDISILDFTEFADVSKGSTSLVTT
jgi:hypothetical protein